MNQLYALQTNYSTIPTTNAWALTAVKSWVTIGVNKALGRCNMNHYYRSLYGYRPQKQRDKERKERIQAWVLFITLALSIFLSGFLN